MAVVLVVDDEDDVVVLCRVALEAHGHRVLVAADGLEALEVVDGHEVDAVVTDLMMPRMDGVDLRTALADRCADLPVLLWSAAPPPVRDGVTVGGVEVKDPLALDVEGLLRGRRRGDG